MHPLSQNPDHRLSLPVLNAWIVVSANKVCSFCYATVRCTTLLFLLLAIASCTAPKKVAVTVIQEPLVTEDSSAPSAVPSQEAPSIPDVELGRFDGGKMWTFMDPPVDYIEESHGVEVDSSWFDKARLGALRFADYCSASFVTASGLVLTNHHCARESVEQVNGADEDLPTDGFYAASREEERRVEDLYVEQLVETLDVTDRVRSASRVVRGDNEKIRARANKARDIERQLTEVAQVQDSTLRVVVVDYFDGVKYAAHTYRRYEDVRLVMVPETKLAFFGGGDDNFTFPRYALDVAFFRVYGDDGQPVVPDSFFSWSVSGAHEGDAVFTVGAPGSTSRLESVASLEYERDYMIPKSLAVLQARAAVLERYLDANEDPKLQNTLFSIENSIKSLTGQLTGLRDKSLLDRRLAAELLLQRDILAHDSLASAAGSIFQDLRELQRSKISGFKRSEAFVFFGTFAGSSIFTRALYGYYLHTLGRRGFVDPEVLEDLGEEARSVQSLPAAVEREFIALRINEIRAALGDLDPTVVRILGGQLADSVAARVVSTTALTDSSAFAELLDKGFLSSDDVTVEIIEALAPLFFSAQEQSTSYANREELLNSQIVSARLELYGELAPPDANGTLRISDGQVLGYASNGTVAPAFTTFFGLYDHHYSYSQVSDDWMLPDRWLEADLELSTPLNLVSTNDIAGGNSGSALLNQNLEVVGLVFDGNMESLPNTYLYSDTTARTISVDSRGILEALEKVYQADELVRELRGE